MANKKISELTTRTPSLSDLMLVGDPSSGYSFKCTVTALATIIETDIADGYVTLGTAQTISGAKTFSNNLTLTSVSNAGVDTDKFLVLSGSNVVNFRTGAEVLSDIGAQAVLTNPITGTGTSGQVSYFNGTNSITSSPTFAFTPTSQLLVNNSVTAASAIARGINATPTLTAAANNDVLVGLDIAPTFTNGAFTGVTNYAARFQNDILVQKSQNAQAVINTTSTGSATILRLQNNGNNIGGLTGTGSTFGYGTYAQNQNNLTGGSGGIGIRTNNSAPIRFYATNADADFSTVQMQMFASTGNVTLQNGGTFTDAGFKLDVSGTARVQDNVTISQTTTGGVALSVTTPSGGANIMRLLRTGNIQADLTTVGSNAFQWSSSWYYTGGVTIGVAPSTAVPTASWLQVNSGISIGNTLNGWNASAILDANSSTRGFLQPRMTTANRDAISTPATGLSVYNTSTNTNDYYNGSAWLNVGQVLVPANNTTGFSISGSSLTGSNAQSLVSLSQTWNTTGNPTAIKLDVTNTASGNNSYLLDLQVGGIPQFTVFKGGEIKTSSPAGGVAQTWKLGSVQAVTPTSPNRTIEVEVNGTTYYLHAKTTND